jgi:hypothetical protein
MDVPPEVLIILEEWLEIVEKQGLIDDAPRYNDIKTFVDKYWAESEDRGIILHSGCNLTTKVHIPGCSCIYSR